MTEGSPSTRSSSPVLGVVVVAGLAVAVGSFLVLDPVLAAFVAIVVGVGLAMAVLARDWDRHESFEERELLRAQRRKEKWERNAGARAKDRARWEAHQARKAARESSD
ncbi:hypothetical protein DQ244_16445 [Blastococcus sp. TBT05-19]|uniref:hypothetical protein n=1 Tax=Blastococcus sp. TBT05-19 TaxID=2250581 RepID=UPI000DE8085D|nr:hypothetical protein [Blastococcus sp. TBT05-19]RBY88138.1 hypothetical protein DQ244_16445 [Blastococcus sp. TBT05-19]